MLLMLLACLLLRGVDSSFICSSNEITTSEMMSSMICVAHYLIYSLDRFAALSKLSSLSSDSYSNSVSPFDWASSSITFPFWSNSFNGYLFKLCALCRVNFRLISCFEKPSPNAWKYESPLWSIKVLVLNWMPSKGRSSILFSISSGD